jgi:hypothetical protein
MALLLASGLAFGGVYWWAFGPMLFLASVVASETLGLQRRIREAPRGVAIGLACWGGAIALQLLPLPQRMLQLVSPRTDQFLRAWDVSYAWARHPWHALSVAPAATSLGLAFVVVFAAIALTVSVIVGDASETFASGIAAIGAVIAVTGIVGAAAHDGLILGLWQPPPHTTPFGPFLNRNHFGAWMVMAVAVTLADCHRRATDSTVRAHDGRAFVKWLGTADGSRWLITAAAVMLMVLAVVLTRSRSAIVSLIVVVFLLHGLAVRAHTPSTMRFGVLALIVIACLSADVAAAAQRFTADPRLDSRRVAWADAITIARDFPAVGVGWNAYGVASATYEIGSTSPHFAASHNDYLQMLAEGGLIVASMVVAVVIVAAGTVGGWARADAGIVAGFWLRRGALVGIAAMACHECVDFSLQVPANGLLFACLCGAAVHRPSVVRLDRFVRRRSGNEG